MRQHPAHEAGDHAIGDVGPGLRLLIKLLDVGTRPAIEPYRGQVLSECPQVGLLATQRVRSAPRLVILENTGAGELVSGSTDGKLSVMVACWNQTEQCILTRGWQRG